MPCRLLASCAQSRRTPPRPQKANRRASGRECRQEVAGRCAEIGIARARPDHHLLKFGPVGPLDRAEQGQALTGLLANACRHYRRHLRIRRDFRFAQSAVARDKTLALKRVFDRGAEAEPNARPRRRSPQRSERIAETETISLDPTFGLRPARPPIAGKADFNTVSANSNCAPAPTTRLDVIR